MNNLDNLRKEIDAIDEELLALFAKRFGIVKEIGQLKKAQGIPAQNKEREGQVLKKIGEKARQLSLNEDTAKSIWMTIFKESYKME